MGSGGLRGGTGRGGMRGKTGTIGERNETGGDEVGQDEVGWGKEENGRGGENQDPKSSLLQRSWTE